jgi:uncharacterized protein DUF4232
MVRTSVSAVLLCLLAAGCGAMHPAAAVSAGPQAIPWLALPASSPPPEPTPHAIPVPPGTPACIAGQLTGAVVGSGGATGHIITLIAFTGSGQTACFLDGTPSVTLLDAAGRTLAFQARPPYAPSTPIGPALVEPGPPPQPYAGPQPGQAYMTIDWDSQPEPCPGESEVVPAEARIAIPAGGTLSIPIPSEPGGYVCQGLGVGKFHGPQAPAPPAPTPPPMPSVSLRAPATAQAGKPYRYLVTLRNDSTQSIDLRAVCPNYEEALFSDSASAAGKGFYRLNCGPAGTITPAQSVTFEIVLDVFAGAQPGPYTLEFGLMRWDIIQKDGATAPVTVVSG